MIVVDPDLSGLLLVHLFMDEPNAVVETPVVEVTNEAPQAEPETIQEEVNTEPQPDQVETPEEPPKESDSHKPTRAERRIQQLLNKQKESTVPSPQGDVFGNQLPPWWQQPESSQDGELTMEQLNQKMMTVAQLAVAKDRQEQGFRQTVGTHQSELTELADAPEFGDKNFDSKFTRLYANLNYDETGAFRPKMTPKELFNELKGVIKLGESNGQAEATNSMAKTIANAAVTPTSSRPDMSNDDKQRKLSKARQTHTTEDWAAYLKDIL